MRSGRGSGRWSAGLLGVAALVLGGCGWAAPAGGEPAEPGVREPAVPTAASGRSPEPASGAAADGERVAAGAMRAWSWSGVPEACDLITPMIWVRFEDGEPTDPATAAARSRRLPPGESAVFLWDAAKRLLTHPGDAVRPGGGGEATPGLSPWPERGIDWVGRRVGAFFDRYRAAGGRTDGVILDYERGLSVWHFGDKRAERVRQIAADPRFEPLSERMGLGPRGLQRVIGAGSVSYTLREGSLEAMVRRGPPAHLRWNTAMQQVLADAIDRGVFGPAGALEPGVISSNYRFFDTDPDHPTTDYNGVPLWDTRRAGTANSPAYYGRLGSLMYMPTAGGERYGGGPFAALRFEVNQMRAIAQSSEAPVVPWVCRASWEGSKYDGTPYHRELIYHLALGGVTRLLYWNPVRSGGPGGKPQQERDALALNGWMREVSHRLGAGPARPVTPAVMPWDSELIVSGAATDGGRVLWRVSVPDGVRAVRVEPGGEVLPTEGGGLWYASGAQEEVAFRAVMADD